MTIKSVKISIATALAVSTLGTAMTQAADNRLLLQRATPAGQMAPLGNRAIAKMKLKFDCVVAGTPVEFPNDIRISNPYNFAVAAGTVVAYSAPFGNSGTVVLPALAPGAGFFVSNAVPGGITAGAACAASQI